MSKVRFLLFNGLLIFGIMVGSVGCSSTPAEELPTPTPIPTSVVPTKPTYLVQRGEVVEVLDFHGRVAPVIEEELFFRTDGRSRNIYFEEGDFVKAGQVIADLEFLDDLERQLASNQLSLRRAEIQVSNAEYSLELFKLNTPSPEMQQALALQALADAEQAVADAERALGITQSTAGQADIDAAYAQVILSEKALERAQDNFEPYANKPEDNPTRAQLKSALSAAQRNHDDAVRRYNAMTGTASESEQSIAAANLAVAQVRLLEAQAEWERVQENPVPLGYEQELALQENDLELAQIALSETQFSVTDLEESIADATLVAPFDGKILTISFSEGRAIEAFKPLVLIADMSALEISANLTSAELEGVEEGMPVTAEFVSNPGEPIEGFIRRLPYLAGGSADVEDDDQTTRITLDVSLDELGAEVGDLMRITLIIEQKEDVLWLPPQAIRTFEGRRFVVVQEEDYQQRVDVKLGIEGEDRIEILEGLEEGQIVVSP
jgi:HlyD family secretion protein